MFQINHVKRTVLSVVLGVTIVAVSVLSGVLLTNAQGSEDCRTFPETGHKVCGKFLTYWDSHGGLAQQGFPISETLRKTAHSTANPIRFSISSEQYLSCTRRISLRTTSC